MTLQNGMELGKYRIVRRIGQGGMADVYEAEDAELGRKVALKLLPPEFARDPQRVARFMKEVRNSAALEHPNIIPIYDVGEGDGFHFYTMQLLDGGDLKERIKAGLSQQEARAVLKQVAAALGAAHAKGVVHRDVKPENVMFDSEGRAVLTDLGIARAASGGTRMTKAGMSVGTPHYMSPEQARGKDVDGRSDIYSLGIVFYEMLTGQVPYDAEESFAVGYMHINEPVPVLPPALSSYQPMLGAMLAKDADHRYPDCAALIADMERVERGDKAQGVAAAADESSRTAPQAALGSSGLKAVAIGALAALLVAGGAYWFINRGSSSVAGRGGSGGAVIARTAPAPVDTPERGQKGIPPIAEIVGKGTLVVSSDPDKAQVTLDGRSVGRTPLTLKGVSAGAHDVTVAKRFYEPSSRKLDIAAETVAKEAFALKRGSGALSLSSEPAGARVMLDGKPCEGVTPLSIQDVPAGKHLLEVRLDKYAPQTHAVIVEGGALSEHFVLSPPARYRMTVKPEPEDATVKILNIRERYTPGMELEPGRYHVEVSREGYGTTSKWVELKDADETFQVQLEAGRRSLTVKPDLPDAVVELVDAGLAYHDGVALKPGTYMVKISRRGYQPATRRVDIGDEDVVLSVVLEPRPGAVWVEPVTRMEFVWVPGGCFKMGGTSGDDDEKPRHEACVQGVWIGKYEVTQAEWRAVMGSNPSHFKGDRNPVENVSWTEAQAFIGKLNDRGNGAFRLPTEAEWEYAARGGARDSNPLADDADRGAWYKSNSGQRTHPVGGKAANRLGLYDMGGNVWEWCQDWYGESYYSKAPRMNPKGPGTGSKRVKRGGCWYDRPKNLRPANRDWYEPDFRDYHIGFRLVRAK